MKNANRAFLLGAGFSKAVADGPLMKGLWCHIERTYKRQENRTYISPEDKLRVKWFNDLNNFVIRLEKEATSLWFPLCGYAGVCQFEKEQDKETLVEAGKYSKLRIHKMHGSINWKIPEPRSLERLQGINEVMIVMDDWENNGFHFDGLLRREPVKTKSPYVGGHKPGWVLRSLIKPFENK